MKQSNRASMAIAALFVVFSIATLSGCVSIADEDSTAAIGTLGEWQGADRFAETFELELPASARDIYLLEGGFQDPFYQVRFTIDQADLALLETSVGCGGFVSETDVQPPSDMGPQNDHDWWQPETAADLRCVGYNRPSRTTDIAIELVEADSAVVYIWAVLF